jgi:hypothetical protein
VPRLGLASHSGVEKLDAELMVSSPQDSAETRRLCIKQAQCKFVAYFETVTAADLRATIRNIADGARHHTSSRFYPSMGIMPFDTEALTALVHFVAPCAERAVIIRGESAC